MRIALLDVSQAVDPIIGTVVSVHWNWLDGQKAQMEWRELCRKCGAGTPQTRLVAIKSELAAGVVVGQSDLADSV